MLVLKALKRIVKIFTGKIFIRNVIITDVYTDDYRLSSLDRELHWKCYNHRQLYR